MEDGKERPMDEIIKKVISIDQNARSILSSTQVQVRSKEKQVKDDVESIKLQTENTAREEGKALYDVIINQAEKQQRHIIQQACINCEVLEQKYLDIKDGIEAQIFDRLFREGLREE